MRVVLVSLALLASYCATSGIGPRYQAWTSPRWEAAAEQACLVTVYALSSHPTFILWKDRKGHITQVSATAISEDVKIPAGTKWTRTYAFLDPESGEILAKRRVRFRCFKKRSGIRPFVWDG